MACSHTWTDCDVGQVIHINVSVLVEDVRFESNFYTLGISWKWVWNRKQDWHVMNSAAETSSAFCCACAVENLVTSCQGTGFHDSSFRLSSGCGMSQPEAVKSGIKMNFSSLHPEKWILQSPKVFLMSQTICTLRKLKTTLLVPPTLTDLILSRFVMANLRFLLHPWGYGFK